MFLMSIQSLASILPLAAGGAFALWFAFGWPAWLTFLCHVPLFAAGEYWLAQAERRPTDKWLLVGCLLREALHQIIQMQNTHQIGSRNGSDNTPSLVNNRQKPVKKFHSVFH